MGRDIAGGRRSGAPTHRETGAGLTRRSVTLGSLAAGTALAFGDTSAAAQDGGRAVARRISAPKIDVHHHMVPPVWAEAMRALGAAHGARAWSPQASLDFMDKSAIQTAMLSLTTSGVTLWEGGSQRRQMIRQINEYGAGLTVKWPGRFGHFATLPLPDIDGALSELAYAFDQLRADGVILMSNIGNRYLGDPFFAPLWAELDRRGAVVFIHPNSLTLPEIAGVPASLVDFPFATTRAAVDMVVHGVFTLQSKMKVILAHGGGFLPYVSQRLVEAGSTLPGSPGANVLREIYRRFYFDTALSSSDPTLAALKAFAGPGRILFGSDFPYAAGLSGPFTDTFDASGSLSDAEHSAVARGNAAPLFAGRSAR